MMNGESGVGCGIRRYEIACEFSLNSSSSARDGPALSPGNWLISVSGSLTREF